MGDSKQGCTDEVAKAFYGKFDGMGYGGKTTVELYSQWSDKFEHDNLNMRNGYQHPVKIANVAAGVLPEKSCRILDLCAGTGLGGQALFDLGFTNVDALDGSAGMLAQAKAKGIYKNIYEELITEEKLKSVEDATYDAIVTSGSFVPGHLGPKQLRVIARVLKPGGLFVMALRSAFLESDYLCDLEPEMGRMVQDGIWQKVKHETMDYYHNDLPGTIYVYRKC